MPGSQVIRSVILPERLLVASSQVQIELGVNPISHLDILLTGPLNGVIPLPLATNIANYLQSIRVIWKGAAAFDLRGGDALAVGNFIHGKLPMLVANTTTSSGRFILGIRVPFSRHPYMLGEGLPSIKRGDLLLELNTGALPANITSANVIVTQHEIPDASPERWLRSTTLQRTPTATGDLDIDLPLGNVMTGLTMFSTTVPIGTVVTTTIDQLRLLVNNQETFLSSGTWEDLQWAGGMSQQVPGFFADHAHDENTAVGYGQNVVSGGIVAPSSGLNNYAYLDMDPDGLTTFSLDLAQPNQCVARVTAGDTNLLRLIPHNLVPVS